MGSTWGYPAGAGARITTPTRGSQRRELGWNNGAPGLEGIPPVGKGRRQMALRTHPSRGGPQGGYPSAGRMKASSPPPSSLGELHPRGRLRASLQGTGCAGGHGTLIWLHKPWSPSAHAWMKGCGVGISRGQEYPHVGVFPTTGPQPPMGWGWTLTAPHGLCQRLLAHGLCLPHLPEERRGFQPATPPARSRAPPEQQYLHLLLQVLGSRHQGLDLAQEEREVSARVSSQPPQGDTGPCLGCSSPLRAAAPGASPQAPLQREEGCGISSAPGTGPAPAAPTTATTHRPAAAAAPPGSAGTAPGCQHRPCPPPPATQPLPGTGGCSSFHPTQGCSCPFHSRASQSTPHLSDGSRSHLQRSAEPGLVLGHLCKGEHPSAPNPTGCPAPAPTAPNPRYL